MKTEDLRESVAALGFESDIYDEGLFILSANRALNMIFTEREVTEEAFISTDFPPPKDIIRSYVHTGASTVFSLHGSAYSFRASGKGSYSVEDSLGKRVYGLLGEGVIYRGFITGEATICFFGDYRFSVYNLASFDSVHGPELSDIPVYGSEQEIDLSSRIRNFVCAASLPLDEDGMPIKGARTLGTKLFLPKDVTGEIRLVYRRSPEKIRQNSDADIDIPCECECLLPLLTASFMWLEDDADMAQYYMALYRSALMTVRGEVAGRLDTGYSTNGWA